MSFGEQFRQQALPAFRHVYVRVTELERVSKEQLNKHRASGEETPSRPALRFILNRSDEMRKGTSNLVATPTETSVFESVLKSELDRLTKFVESFSEELWMRLGSTLETLEDCARSMKSPKQRVTVHDDVLASLECDCGELCESFIALDKFQRQNVLAAAFLAQQYDVLMQDKKNKRVIQSVEQISPVYLKAMEQYLIQEGALDPLLLGLSQAYAMIRKMRSRVLGEDCNWEPPDVFTRNTTKYWIHPADVLRVKCMVIKHLPILIFGSQPSENSPVSKLSPLKEQQQRERGLISSVYFDTEKLDTYHERLIREHGASLVRIRWYGKEILDPEDKVFVERKVHKDGWTGERSYKERADLPSNEVVDFLRGMSTASMTPDNSKRALLLDMQERILARHEVPSVRTEYRRTAFQESSSNRVRMSLDTKLRILREFGASKSDLSLCHKLNREAGGIVAVDEGEWCRSLKSKVGDADVIHFPYAVFEIKIHGDEPPEWVQEVIESGLLVEVPKFSKFLHGSAMLFGSKLRNSPSWFAPDDEGYMTPATIHELEGKVGGCGSRATGFMLPPRISKREHATSNSLSQRPMQVSTLCHVPDHHTVLSEVVVMQSSQQNASNSRRVMHTSVHGSNHLPSTRQRPLTNAHAEHNLELSINEEVKRCKWRFPWKREESNVHNSPKGSRAAALVRTRIEPKTFFANERTFLSWLTVAVMVMFMGLSLLDASTTTRSGLGFFGSSPGCHGDSNAPIHITNLGNGTSTTTIHETSPDDGGLRCNAARISGAMIAPMALILMVYALYMYRKRSLQILRRETVRYDDQYGPVVLTLLLVTVLFLAYVLSVK